MLRFTRNRSCIKSQKILANLDLFVAVFAGRPSYLSARGALWNIASQIYRYRSIAETRNAALQDMQL